LAQEIREYDKKREDLQIPELITYEVPLIEKECVENEKETYNHIPGDESDKSDEDDEVDALVR
jgi:hypothetical protein